MKHSLKIMLESARITVFINGHALKHPGNPFFKIHQILYPIYCPISVVIYNDLHDL
jgi:hypothetical protein